MTPIADAAAERLLLDALSALAALVGELDRGAINVSRLRRAGFAPDDLGTLGMAVNRGRTALRAIRRATYEPSK